MKNFKKIDDYFSNNLTADLREEFEQELQKDNDLRNEYDTYRASQNLIEFMIQEDLMGKLPQLVSDDEDIQYASQYNINDDNQNFSPTHAPKEAKIVSIDQNFSTSDHKNSQSIFMTFRKSMRVAASFLVLIVCGTLVWMNIRSGDFSGVTNDNIVFVDMSQMRSGDIVNENYNKLVTLQEEGDYVQANKTIDQLIAADNETYSYLIFFKAQNNFRLKNFAEADKQFEQVINGNMPKYTEDAQMMRVFTAIELDDTSLAKKRITDLENQPMFSYKEKLVKIKDRL